jgi:hypothetical protein
MSGAIAVQMSRRSAPQPDLARRLALEEARDRPEDRASDGK